MLIYSGKLDYVCNYFGGRAWTKLVEWDGKVREENVLQRETCFIIRINLILQVISLG